jgi:hypothetical protein
MQKLLCKTKGCSRPALFQKTHCTIHDYYEPDQFTNEAMRNFSSPIILSDLINKVFEADNITPSFESGSGGDFGGGGASGDY